MIIQLSTIYKTPDEKMYRTCEFKRPDGEGWLKEGETVTDCSVIIESTDTGEPIADMVDRIASYRDTQVRFYLKNGEENKKYLVRILAMTSGDQTFEARADLEIL